jgi:hypothetical protein
MILYNWICVGTDFSTNLKLKFRLPNFQKLPKTKCKQFNFIWKRCHKSFWFYIDSMAFFHCHVNFYHSPYRYDPDSHSSANAFSLFCYFFVAQQLCCCVYVLEFNEQPVWWLCQLKGDLKIDSKYLSWSSARAKGTTEPDLQFGWFQSIVKPSLSWHATVFYERFIEVKKSLMLLIKQTIKNLKPSKFWPD